MKPPIGTEISVRRRIRDGWHVYTCAMLPGLYVASKDDQAAYNDLPSAIRTLILLDYKRNVTVTHKVDYRDFLRQMQLQERAKEAVTELLDELMDDDAIPFLISATDGDAHAQ